ncbi:MAG: HipA domain-containing protein [Deltaproteobacteria bacterium]|nr:HipA domain-containing protein [Deltaproteobacteria bacterium]
MAEEIPIRRVRANGTVDVIGHYGPTRRHLSLAEAGFPLLAAGEHDIDGDVPWVFYEMAPAGFIAKRFAGWYPDLHLPEDARLWGQKQVLLAISACGHDLPGNLLVGEGSWQRYLRIFGPSRTPGPERTAARREYVHFVNDILSEPGGSSVGGERPKFSLRLNDGGAVLVKFTPPLETVAGVRWGDLLRMEQHASQTLRAAGVLSVTAQYVELGSRGYLEIDRYDRLPGGGRCGATTFYFLGVGLYGEVSHAPLVAQALVKDGHLTAEDAALVDRVHRFSAALGNTDAHLGNYGLLINDDGAVSLAPFYDISPMVMAPRHDELPDARLAPLPVPDAPTAALVRDLRDRARADNEISRSFLETWERHVAAAFDKSTEP